MVNSKETINNMNWLHNIKHMTSFWIGFQKLQNKLWILCITQKSVIFPIVCTLSIISFFSSYERILSGFLRKQWIVRPHCDVKSVWTWTTDTSRGKNRNSVKLKHRPKRVRIRTNKKLINFVVKRQRWIINHVVIICNQWTSHIERVSTFLVGNHASVDLLLFWG